MTTDVSDVLERLLALSAHDVQIRRLDGDLSRAPASLVEHETAAAAIAAKSAAVVSKLNVLKAQMRLRELELKTHEAKVAKLKSQSSEVRTNKEFMAFRSEIANTQAEADRMQTEILRILDVVDQAEARIKEYAQERQNELDAMARAKVRIEENLQGIKKDRDHMLSARPALLEGIPPEAMDIYERTRTAHGRGMAHLEGSYCSACGDLATRNEVYAVHNRTQIVSCKGCNCILYLT